MACKTLQHSLVLTVVVVLAVVCSNESYAKGTYEFYSVRPPGKLARVEVSDLPVETVESIVSITFLDPSSPHYQVSSNMGVRLTGVIDEASQPELGEWGQLIVEWDQAEVRPSWMEGFENEDVTFSINNGFDRGWVHFPGPVWGIGGQAGEWVLVPEPENQVLVLAWVLCVAVQRRRMRIPR